MKFISLTENHLFSKAYRSKLKSVTRTCAVYVMKDRLWKKIKNENPMKQSVNRVGISASKKVGGAVERNRAKRVVREAYRQIDSDCGIKSGYIIVIAVRTRAAVVKMQEVKADLAYALASLDMLCRADGKNTPDTAEKSGVRGDVPSAENKNDARTPDGDGCAAGLGENKC